jgi:hypothetical protein
VSIVEAQPSRFEPSPFSDTVNFLSEIFRGTQGQIYFCALRNSDSKLQKGELDHIVTRSPDEVKKFVAKWDRPEHECGIYFCTATLKPGTTRRVAENCDQFTSLFADVDDKNHDLARSVVRDLLEQSECPPAFIVGTGNGLHPYWPPSEPSADAERIIAARKGIQSITASDKVHDAPRVMRLPGSHNSKGGKWQEVRIVSHLPEYRHSLAALENFINRAPIIIPPKPDEKKPEPQHKPNGACHQYHDVVDIDRVRDALKHVPADDRQLWLEIGMALNDAYGDAGRAIWDDWSATCAQKFNDRDQEKTWRSFNGSGIGIGTLFMHAQKYGWRPHSNGHDGGSGALSLDDFHCYMAMPNSYIFTPTREIWPASSVNARVPAIPIEGRTEDDEEKEIKPNSWLQKNRAVEQLTWAPGLPMLIKDRVISGGGWIERPGSNCFNLYNPPTIESGDAGQAGPWLEHVRKVYPEHTDHLLRWFAQRVQHPEVKINHAIVLGGAQGIGKDTMLEPVKRAVGPWNFEEVSPQAMLRRFNSFLKSVILRVSEARDLGDVNRYQFYDHMKSYTAAPPDVLRVDEKHIREHSVLNCTGVIITTNHLTDGIFLPAEDRRHYVAWSERTLADFSDAYWNDLWGWYETGGYSHVAAYLRELDLSSFDPKRPPEKTAAFWNIVSANRAPESGEIADILDKLNNPPVISLARLQGEATGDAALWLIDRKNRRAIPHRLEECGYVAVRNPGAKDGLWKIGQTRQVVYASSTLSGRDQIAAVQGLLGGTK